MKKATLITAMALAATMAGAQIPQDYQVAPWHGFSKCAITYSFDDLCANQLPVAIPILDKYNVKATFNIVTNWVKPDQWAPLKDIAANGHEIASHTISHPNMGELSREQYDEQQRESKRIIQEKTGVDVTTMVYPYCVAKYDDITEQYYIAARVCDKRIEPHTPAKMMRISSVGVGSESAYNDSQALNKWVDDAAQANGWCTFLLHGIDGDGGYSPLKSTDLEDHIKYVTGNPRKFWPATFAQISKYIMERDGLSITESSYKKGYKVTVMCSAKSNLTKLDEPVTISRTMPQGWKDATVRCNGKAIASKIENGKVIFDVVPSQSYEVMRKKIKIAVY